MVRLRARIRQMIEEDDVSLLPAGKDWPSMMVDAFTEAVSNLERELGGEVSGWQWGKVHHTRPRHPLSALFPELGSLLDPPSVPMGGDGDTLQAGSYSPGEPFVMTSMSVARYAFDLGDWDNSAWVVPLGSSGHPGSAHYADQASVWQQVQMAPMTYSWQKVETGAETRQELRPG